MAELQVIPARHGVATFVPAGQTLKIINSSGSQVIDTWAFALPKPDGKKDANEQDQQEDEREEQKPEQKQQEQKSAPKSAPAKKGKKDNDFPTQEDAEKATQEGIKQGDQSSSDAKNGTPQKNTWSSYVPGLGKGKKGGETPKKDEKKGETEQQKNSRTWASYFPSGKGFSSYIPKSASNTVSAFAKDFQRDQNKSYIEQLQDFSKTPVGAAGLSALTGSGYSSALYSGYQAWNQSQGSNAPAMEYMSMPHCRASTLHIRPKVNDTLVSNVREPMLVMVEDTSPGIHDTLMAACDPQRYQGLGVDNWEEHGSCAENLVPALKELNERAGLKGPKAIGAAVTINSVPAPLNLFMNIPWDDDGDLGFKAPKGKEGDYVRLKAERDVVVVMSACPQDILEINSKKPTDAHFLVEGADETNQQAPKPAPAKKKVPTRKPSFKPSEAGGDDAKAGAAPAKKPVPKRTVPQKKPASGAAQAPQKKPAPKPAQPQKKEGGEGKTNGEATPPVERKKPRKLAQRPKAEAAKPETPKEEPSGENAEGQE